MALLLLLPPLLPLLPLQDDDWNIAHIVHTLLNRRFSVRRASHRRRCAAPSSSCVRPCARRRARWRTLRATTRRWWATRRWRSGS
ncbi:MAG: hypothetical protein ACK4QW_19700, partial [Alphaproteobacteria bacterium]